MQCDDDHREKSAPSPLVLEATGGTDVPATTTVLSSPYLTTIGDGMAAVTPDNLPPARLRRQSGSGSGGAAAMIEKRTVCDHCRRRRT